MLDGYEIRHWTRRRHGFTLVKRYFGSGNVETVGFYKTAREASRRAFQDDEMLRHRAARWRMRALS